MSWLYGDGSELKTVSPSYNEAILWLGLTSFWVIQLYYGLEL